MAMTFVPMEGIRIEAEYKKTRNGFKHEADLWVDGELVASKKCTYLNRTWESYEFQSVAFGVVDKCPKKKLSEEKRVAIKQWLRDYKEPNAFSGIAMVAMMGNIFSDTKKEANDWKARMIKAGLGEGISMPDDWDTLSEEEKERRLDGVIGIMKSES